MSHFSFRDAVPGDEALILRFICELATYENMLDQVETDEAALQRALFGPKPRAEALIVEKGGEAVGFSLWHYSFSTFSGAPSLYVEDVFVREAHRGGGIGRAVFKHLARIALAQGCKRMDWSVLDWNAPAIGFYRSIGAKPIEGWTGQRLTGEALAALAS